MASRRIILCTVLSSNMKRRMVPLLVEPQAMDLYGGIRALEELDDRFDGDDRVGAFRLLRRGMVVEMDMRADQKTAHPFQLADVHRARFIPALLKPGLRLIAVLYLVLRRQCGRCDLQHPLIGVLVAAGIG